MTRDRAFMSLTHHPIYRAAFRHLNHSDLAMCSQFIADHEADSLSEFNAAVTRMFLDQPEKPKAKGIIQDMLAAANTIAKRRGRPERPDGQMVRLDTRVPEGMAMELQAEADAAGMKIGTYVRKIFSERKGVKS